MTKWIIEVLLDGGYWQQRHVCFTLESLVAVLEILLGPDPEKIRTIRVTRVD